MMTSRTKSISVLAIGMLVVIGSGARAIHSASRSAEPPASQEAGFKEVLYDPQEFIGDTVTWGGRIANVSTIPDGIELMITEIPLDDITRPDATQHSRGRFVVQGTAQQLPRDSLKIGDRVRATGMVSGSVTRPLGKEKQYTYPVLKVVAIQKCKLRHRIPREGEGKRLIDSTACD
jgi:starvation-inducible outer membrane lipoprotein